MPVKFQKNEKLMSKLKIKVGDYIIKKGRNVFGRGETSTPVLLVESIKCTGNEKRYVFNEHYHIEQEFLEVVSKKEAERINEIYDSCVLVESSKPDLSSCVREDNGQKKVGFPEKHFKHVLFQAKMRNPDGGFQAYTCKHCGEIHIGKTKE